ncbi:MAG TPA: PAAR domain-containing protein [Polyangia bacterium]|nr:PAAR domain-containing protein [Polyangia bacterium]
MSGSPNVQVNGRPALRVGDTGIHAACCGGNTWTAQQGSATVFINGKPAYRMNDPSRHCGGMGRLIEGSPNVIVGGSTSSGAGGAGAGGGGSGGGGGGGSGPAGAPGSGPGSSAAQSPSSPSATSPESATQPPAESTPSSSSEPASPQSPPRLDLARWSIEYSDGRPVSGVRADYEGPTGPKKFSGSRNQLAGLEERAGYDLTIVGTTKLRLDLRDADGQPVAGARLRIERAFGPTIEGTTDGSGHFEAEGFVGEEPFEVAVLSSPAKAKGRFVDEAGQPVPGLRARVRGDSGTVIDVVSDGDGRFEAEGLLPGEGYTLELERGGSHE